MTRPAFARSSARVSPFHGGLHHPSAPRPRRALACVWERCPATGALACRWEEVAPELTFVAGGAREREQPPSPLSLAA